MTVAVEIDERIVKCRKILDMDPNSQIFAALAEAYRKNGELDKAFRVCQNGLRIHPSYGAAHLVMAKINLDRGLYDWAEAEVQKAMELDGRNRAIELLLAEIFLYKGEYDEATKLLKTLHRSDPDSAHIKRLLEIAAQIPEEDARASQQRRESVAPTQVAPSDMPGAAPEAPVQESSPVEDNRLERADVLREAVAADGVKGAMFINQEGLVVESQWSLDMEDSVCGAELAGINNFVNQELVTTSFGVVKSVQVEARRHIFYLLAVEGGSFLFVGDINVSLGSMRMRVAGLMERHLSA